MSQNDPAAGVKWVKAYSDGAEGVIFRKPDSFYGVLTGPVTPNTLWPYSSYGYRSTMGGIQDLLDSGHCELRSAEPTVLFTPTPSPTPAPKPTPAPTPSAAPTDTPMPAPTPEPPEATPPPSSGRLPVTNNVRWLEQKHPALHHRLETLSWVEDGLSEVETDVVEYLLYMGVGDIGNLTAVLDLEWLGKTPETADMLAVRALWRLGRVGRLSGILDHQFVKDGITSEEAVLVAAAGTLRNADEMGRLLDPGYASVQTVTIPTERTPTLQVSIVRIGSESVMDTVELVADAVGFVEDLMQRPLPVDHVVVALHEGATVQDYAGTNFGFAIGYLPHYEQARKHALMAGLPGGHGPRGRSLLLARRSGLARRGNGLRHRAHVWRCTGSGPGLDDKPETQLRGPRLADVVRGGAWAGEPAVLLQLLPWATSLT